MKTQIIPGATPADRKVAVDYFIKQFRTNYPSTLEPDDIDGGLLYTGYPVLPGVEDSNLILDIMYLSESYGIFVITTVSSEISLESALSKEDTIYTNLNAKLLKYPELLKRRDLAFPIKTLTFDPFDKVKMGKGEEELDGSSICKNFADFSGQIIEQRTAIEADLFKKIKSVIQAFSRHKAPNKRENATDENSMGWRLKQVEKQIANLDTVQNRAIIETTKGIQRIRGLAGSGKTIVLASKAAYLHATNPSDEIAVTFFSRSLYRQYNDFITRFCFEHTNEAPDFDKIRILHGWGAYNELGVYQRIARANGFQPLSFKEAERGAGGGDKAFRFACDALLHEIKGLNRPVQALFDIMLIDEAQDLPRSFFELCYLSLRGETKRIIWAYDENQQLNDLDPIPSPQILFGSEADGTPRVDFSPDPDERQAEDTVLEACYRSPKEIITLAHALGFAIYMTNGPIQMIEDRSQWQAIGYEVQGDLTPNSDVTLTRTTRSSPSFLSDNLKGTKIIESKVFEDFDAESQWIAEQIKTNLEHDQLTHRDILVICAVEPMVLLSTTSLLRSKLTGMGIANHIAGSDDPSIFFRDGSIAVTHIHRAKGNEAAMVYVMHADMLAVGPGLIRKRNVLFTAISRAKAWVRITGLGMQMTALIAEINAVHKNHYALKFKFPADLANRRRQHSEPTPEERQTSTKENETLRKAFQKIIRSKDKFAKGSALRDQILSDPGLMKDLKDVLKQIEEE